MRLHTSSNEHGWYQKSTPKTQMWTKIGANRRKSKTRIFFYWRCHDQICGHVARNSLKKGAIFEKKLPLFYFQKPRTNRQNLITNRQNLMTKSPKSYNKSPKSYNKSPKSYNKTRLSYNNLITLCYKIVIR
jgi:hypothetical protein